MRTSSAKAKGRRACQILRDKLLEALSTLQPDDIQVTSSGVIGEDLKLSPFARLLIPFSFEVKNVERVNIWDAIRQAKAHALKNKTHPAVCFTRNREPEPWVAVPLSRFTKLLVKDADDLQKAVKVLDDLKT